MPRATRPAPRVSGTRVAGQRVSHLDLNVAPRLRLAHAPKQHGVEVLRARGQQAATARRRSGEQAQRGAGAARRTRTWRTPSRRRPGISRRCTRRPSREPAARTARTGGGGQRTSAPGCSSCAAGRRPARAAARRQRAGGTRAGRSLPSGHCSRQTQTASSCRSVARVGQRHAPGRVHRHLRTSATSEERPVGGLPPATRSLVHRPVRKLNSCRSARRSEPL